MREALFLVVLAIAGAMIVIGVAMACPAAAWAVAGVLLASWAWLALADDGEPS